MKEVSQESAATSERLGSELAVVARRNTWLGAVLASDGALLKSMISQTKADLATPTRSEGASTTTISALSKAGPCSQYEELISMYEIESHKVVLKSASSADDLKTKEGAMDSAKKIIAILAASCKTALTDLQSAQTALKEEATAQKKARDEQAVQDRLVFSWVRRCRIAHRRRL
jgi:hypothetical protein